MNARNHKVPAIVTTSTKLAPPSLLRDLAALAKPRVTGLVMLTAAVGLATAPGEIGIIRAVVALLLTVLLVASANALNSWWERDSDRLMPRTRSRPLPDGRLDANVALACGLVSAAISLPLLYLLVNPVTALLGAIALVVYVLAYTPLKTVHPSALLVGAVPGALPPLMGWTTVTGAIDAGGLALFGIVFAWQMPHVIGLSCKNAEEYAAAGMKVLPQVRGEAVAKRHAVWWAVSLLPLGTLPHWLGFGGFIYLIGSLVLGGAYLAATLVGYRYEAGEAWGRRVLLTSLAYLPLLFALLLLDPGSGG